MAGAHSPCQRGLLAPCSSAPGSGQSLPCIDTSAVTLCLPGTTPCTACSALQSILKNFRPQKPLQV